MFHLIPSCLFMGRYTRYSPVTCAAMEARQSNKYSKSNKNHLKNLLEMLARAKSDLCTQLLDLFSLPLFLPFALPFPPPQGNCVTCDVTYDSDGKQVGDAELFAGMKGAMKILNFTEAEMHELWKIVATVMHLGNIVFGGEL